MYGWGETATPLTLHAIMIKAFDNQPTQSDTHTEIKLLAESFVRSEVMLQAAGEPGYYGEQANTSIRLTKDSNGNNIRMYGNVTIGDSSCRMTSLSKAQSKMEVVLYYLKSGRLWIVRMMLTEMLQPLLLSTSRFYLCHTFEPRKL